MGTSGQCIFCDRSMKYIVIIGDACICAECVKESVQTLLDRGFNPDELVNVPTIDIKNDGFCIRMGEEVKRFYFNPVQRTEQTIPPWDKLCGFLKSTKVKELQQQIEKKEAELQELYKQIEFFQEEHSDAE